MLAADWIIDLGPGAGDEGGRIVAQGTPEQMSRRPRRRPARSCAGAVREPPSSGQWSVVSGQWSALAARTRTSNVIPRIRTGSVAARGPTMTMDRRTKMSASGGYKGPLEQVGPCQWRIPKSYREDMRVDGLIFADDTLIEQIKKDQGPEQVANVATLPGIQKASLAMPDIHWGYGFAIGGVAATDPEEGGVISPGGVGYDINCGVRLLRTNLDWDEVEGPDPAARRPALPRHPHRRRPDRPLPVRQAQADAADGARLGLRRRPGLGDGARPRIHRGRRPARRGRPRPRQRPGHPARATTSAARSARATTSSRSRSSTASSTRPPPRSWACTRGRSPS